MTWLEWYNFIFLAPLLAGVAMAVLVVATGAVGHGDAGDHADGHDGHDGHGDADDGKGFDILGWFGIGRGVPLSLMLPVLLCAFGLAGLTFDVLLEPVLRLPALYAPVAALGGLFASSLVGRAFAKAFVKFADVNRKTSIRGATDLVGCEGTTVFEVDSNNGAANIKDAFGNIHRVSVRSSLPLKANVPVRVVSAENGIYLVEETK
jgi:membrane protein implicated in regulation of membrane protease activity